MEGHGEGKGFGKGAIHWHFKLPAHTEAILEVASEIPVVNQLGFHPYLQRDNGFLSWMREHDIEVLSFNGLVPITAGKDGPLDNILPNIAQKYGVGGGAVLLRWAVNQKVVPITTTAKMERMDEYLSSLDLELTREEQKELARVGLVGDEVFPA